ncbi:ribonuclease P protein subunit p40-like isoform X1 [Hoplias malabaricus]|uniref:ribonuclease P protein subunit p40-like isoform X1 n=2 Tax=Hoplias malabaricus TaxID=27720 RepID=UPI0034630BD7
MSQHLEKCARSLITCEKSNFMNEKSRHEMHVSRHSFNYKISFLIPECGVLPAQMEKVIRNISSYYLVRDFPVHKFLEEKWLETFVKRDGFYALSYKHRIDEDNVVAVLPRGQLILSLDKDTYEQLGLEGKPSLYNHRKVMRHVVTVNLTDETLVPGTKHYQKVLLCLKERVPIKCDFLLSSYNPGDKDVTICSLLSQYTYEKCSPTVCIRTLKNLLCPSLHPEDLQGKSLSCTTDQFLEWLGAVNLNICCDNSAADFLSTYVCPEPHLTVSKALLCTVTGLILPEDINRLLKELKHYFDEPKFTAWVSLTVHGFVDSPVSWGVAEHGFLKGGENFYNFVCFNNQDYWLHNAVGSKDACPP